MAGVTRPYSGSMALHLLAQAVGLGLLLSFIYSQVITFYWTLFRLRHIKGPFAIPVLGNLYDSNAFSFIKWLSQLRKKHGKIFRVFTGNRAYVVLMDKVAAREALTEKVFVKGPDYKNKFGVVFGDGLVTSAGEKHKADRAMFKNYFMESKLLDDLPMLCQQTLAAIESDMMKHVGEEVNIEHFFAVLAWNMFSRYSLNASFPNAAQLSALSSRGSNVIGEHIVLGIPVYKWIPRVKSVVDEMHGFYRQVDPLIDERMKLMASSPDTCPDDLLTAMLRIEPPLSRQQMYSHLVTLQAAGHDTTAYCACYTILLLAQNPEVQMKLKREVKRVLGNSTEIKPEHYKQLTYATNCFQETLRIFSVVPHVTRIATKTVKLEKSGVVVPKGVEVLIPICLLNRDTDEWGEPILKYDPDRFSEDGPEGKRISREAPGKGYFPFGFGTRSCIGATLALIEGTVMVALLAQKFTFHEVPGFKLKVKSGITMVADGGVKVRVEEDKEYATMPIEPPFNLARRDVGAKG